MSNLISYNTTKSDPAYPAPFIIGASVICIVTMAMIIICYKWAARLQKSRRVGQNNENSHRDFPVVGDMQDVTVSATMERFLSNVAKQRPFRFSPRQLAAFTNNFSKVLGSGGYGIVYKGVFPNGMQIAVKVLNNTSTNRDAEQFMAEISTIGKTYHKNLVTLYGFCFHGTMKALVYEYMEFGSLDELLFTNIKWSIDYKSLHDIAIGVAKGIAYLHEECKEKIVHYDIKPENVLLDVSYKPKVADFGLAMLCNQNSSHVILSSYRGTPGYAAPEMLTPYPVTHKCDIYSFGMLLFEIVGRRRNHDIKHIDTSEEWLPQLMYEKFNKNELEDMLTTCGIQEEEMEMAKRTVMVALWCIQYSPKARPIMSSVIKMLEEGIEIEVPPNPFEYIQFLFSEPGSSSMSMGSTSIDSNDRFIAPLVRKSHSIN